MNIKDFFENYFSGVSKPNLELSSLSKFAQVKDLIDNYLDNIPKPNFEFPSLPKLFEDTEDHRAKAVKLEEKVLALSGLKPGKDIHIYDVPITHDGQNYIHTIECGKKNKNVLVLMHGYSGSSVLFYPMLKQLSKKYHVYCIDFLGMGLSSRPEFKCTTPEETIQYFFETFEKWRKAMKIRKYYLAGHSFGGYIAAACAYKNRKGLKGLYLLSPIGVSDADESGVSEEWSQTLGWAKTNFWLAYFQFYCKLYQDKVVPRDLVKKFSPVAKHFIRKYIATLIGENQPQEASDLMGDFLYEMLLIPGGSDQAIHCLMKPPRINAHFSLEKKVFSEIADVPVYCYFGEGDWNDWSGAKRFARSSENKNFTFDLISDSGHQLTLQNPNGVVEKMLLNLCSC